MIISIFKKNYFLQLIVLIMLPLLLWMPAFINPPKAIVSDKLDMPLYNLVLMALPSQSIITTVIAFLLVISQAFLINYIFTYYELTKKNSYFPAFMYLILSSCDYRTMTISSILFANCFVIIALFSFLQCYNKGEGLDQIFLTAFLIAIASLFYVPFVLLMLWIWFGLFNFKVYKWRPILVSFLGLFSPYLVLLVVYYLQNEIYTIINFFPQHFTIIPVLNFMNQPIQIVYMVYLAILIFSSLIYTMSYRNDQKLSIRKRTSTIVILFVFSLLVFVYSMTEPTMSFIFVPTICFLFTIFFFSIKRNLYSNLFIGILILLTIAKIYINY